MQQLKSIADLNLTQIGVVTFSPVQAFLGGGQKLRDWAVGSWLCHYLSAAIAYRWQNELQGIVLMPLSLDCDLSRWLNSPISYQPDGSFWRASLPNVITGLHSLDNWQETCDNLVREEWQKLVEKLETTVVYHEDYRRLINGVGWKVIKGDCQHLWSVYSDSLPLPSDSDRISATITLLHQRIEAQKQGRSWQKTWWAGRTSPSDARLSIWHPGMQPIDNPEGKGRWGMPYGELNRWWEKVATRSQTTGIFSSSDRLNSIELLKRLASLSEIIESTLEKIWVETPPECPWKRFPDRTAAAATWIVDRVDRETWNQRVGKWRNRFLKKLTASSKWGIERVDSIHLGYVHPRVLERRNVRDYWKSEDILNNHRRTLMLLCKNWVFWRCLQPQGKKMLAEWDRTIPQSWDCTIEWTVGWRGDGDNMGDWISGRQYEELGLTEEQWHLTIDKFRQYQPVKLEQNNYEIYRQLNLDYTFTLLSLFQMWNELLVCMTEQQHYGKVIFSGGDDFLLLGSLADAIPLTTNLYRLWNGEPTAITEPTEDRGWVQFTSKSEAIYPIPGKLMTFSLGVVITQRRIPQSLWHRGLERAYKEAKLAGKDRVCLNILFNSNQSFNWICPWSLWTLLMETIQPDTTENTALNRWEKLLFYWERMPPTESSTAIKNLLLVLFKSVDITITESQIEQIWITDAPEIENWQWWRDWIGIRAFLARQALKREQWTTMMTSPQGESA